MSEILNIKKTYDDSEKLLEQLMTPKLLQAVELAKQLTDEEFFDALKGI
jgi:hypothetical protein